MAYAAAGLGVLSFIWGFLKWLTEDLGGGKLKVGGYAAGSPVLAIIGLSLVAGLLAGAATVEKKPLTLTPVVLAVSALLLALGVLIGKSSVDTGGSGPKYGIAIGFILELITILAQVGVLVFGWMTASGRMPARPPAQSWPAQPPQQPYPGQPAQPGGYGAPQPYGPAQPPPSGPPPGYGPPPVSGYGPAPGQ